MPERGPHKFPEGKDLDFHFDRSWSVCSQWDREPAYKEWLGLSSPGRVKQRKSLDTILLDGLKRRCRWFTTDVAIRFIGGRDIPGLEVRSRAGARGTRGRPV